MTRPEGPIIDTPIKVLKHLHNRRRVRPGFRSAMRLAHGILDHLRAEHPHVLAWVPARVEDNLSELRCVVVAERSGSPVAMLKMATGDKAEGILRRNLEGLRWVGSQPQLSEWRRLVPAVIAQGQIDDVVFGLEGWISGVLGDQGSEGGDVARSRLTSAARAIGELASKTAGSAKTLAVASSLERPMSVLKSSLRDLPDGERLSHKADRIHVRLATAAGGRPATASHGDYWLGNVFFKESHDVSGIIDWGGYSPAAIADIDLVALLLSARMLRSSSQLSETVKSVVVDGWRDWESDILTQYAVESDWAISEEATLISWLTLVAGNMEKGEHFAGGTRWFRKNVLGVLNEFG